MNAAQLEGILKEHVVRLCVSERNTTFCPEGLERAASWLGGVFQASGWEVRAQDFPADGVLCRNLDAVAPDFVGNHRPHLIVGAHYDSAPGTPGADDNASAMAILLELARRLAGRLCAKRLRLVAYANEEPPHFYSSTMGSIVHAKVCKTLGDRIVGMVCLESLGVFLNYAGSQQLPPEIQALSEEVVKMLLPPDVRPEVGNFLAVIGNPASSAFMQSFGGLLKSDARLPVFMTDELDLRLSDHLAYWAEDFPAIMLTDTAFYRNQHYHQETDTPEKLDYATMAVLAERIALAVEEFAETIPDS